MSTSKEGRCPDFDALRNARREDTWKQILYTDITFVTCALCHWDNQGEWHHNLSNIYTVISSPLFIPFKLNGWLNGSPTQREDSWVVNGINSLPRINRIIRKDSYPKGFLCSNNLWMVFPLNPIESHFQSISTNSEINQKDPSFHCEVSFASPRRNAEYSAGPVTLHRDLSRRYAYEQTVIHSCGKKRDNGHMYDLLHLAAG